MKVIYYIAIVILVVVSALFYKWQFSDDEEVVIIEKTTESLDGTLEATNEAEYTLETRVIWVHVDGEVARAGVYQLPEGARVYEAIELAGGLLEDGTDDGINLARVLRDGEKIFVPSTIAWEASESERLGNTGPISLSNANKESLLLLNGIGESKAQAIISYRQEHGPFENIEEIKNVQGIGDALFEGIKDDIVP